MFITIDRINYFINNAKEKDVTEIYREIFLRMEDKYVSYEKKRLMLQLNSRVNLKALFLPADLFLQI